MNVKKNIGFSLIEIVIAIGALAAIAMFGIKLTKTQTQSNAKASFSRDSLFVINEINTTLSDNDNCFNTFSTTDTPEGISIFNKSTSAMTPNYIANNKIYLGQSSPAGYGSSGKIQIDSYLLTPQSSSTSTAGSEEILKIYLLNSKILVNAAGSNRLTPKTIKLHVQRDPVTKKVISCHGLSSVQTDIWQKATGKHIYYQGRSVGINTDSPDPLYTLDLRNSTGATVIDPITTASFLSPGNLCLGSKFTPSDKRLKENILTLNDSLKKVLAIRGVSFNWKTTGKHDVGVIAQEVQKQIPEVVSQNSVNDILSVDYQKLVPYLIEAIKSNQRKIDSLKIKLNDLQK